jgi:hypothetical protein
LAHCQPKFNTKRNNNNNKNKTPHKTTTTTTFIKLLKVEKYLERLLKRVKFLLKMLTIQEILDGCSTPKRKHST